jgi:hypothetical protein
VEVVVAAVAEGAGGCVVVELDVVEVSAEAPSSSLHAVETSASPNTVTKSNFV